MLYKQSPEVHADGPEGHADGQRWASEWANDDELEPFARLVGDGNYELLDRGGDYERPHSLVDYFAARDGENVISVGVRNDPYWRAFADAAAVYVDA